MTASKLYIPQIGVFALFLCIIASSSKAMSPDPLGAWTLSIGRHSHFGDFGVIYSQNFNESSDYIPFSVNGYSLNLRYSYSRWTAIEVEGYSINECYIESNRYGVGCNRGAAVSGGKLGLLTGINMDKQGLYAYSGVRYYREGSHGDFVVPLGVGLAVSYLRFDLSIELRDTQYHDLYDEGFFTEPSDSNTEVGYTGVAVPIPVILEVGIRF